MKITRGTKTDLLKETEELRGRLKDAEEKIRTYRKKEPALFSAQKLARFILDQSTDAMILCDERGRITQTSQMARRFFTNKLRRRPFDQVCPLILTSLLPHESTQFSISSVLGGKTFRSREVTYRQNNGGISYFLLSARPLSDGKNIPGCLVALTDITERKHAEQERERLQVQADNERRRLEAVMEALPVGVSITDARGGNIRVNHAFKQAWGGFPPPTHDVSDYVVYKAWWEDTGQPVKPEEWASARAVQKKETVVGQLMQIERFDGTRGFILNSAAPILAADGRVTGSAVAIQDITPHREAEMKYSKIVATSLSGFWISDQRGRLLEVNDALCRMLGYTREELLALSIADVEADERPAEVLDHIGVLRQKKVDHFFSRHRRKDGSIIDVEVNSTWLDIGEGQLVCFLQDITERKRIERQLSQAAKKYSTLFDATSDGVWIHNLDGEIIEVNDAYCRMSGYSRDELIRMPISKLEAVEPPEEIAHHIRKVIETGGHDRFESRHRRKDGSIFNVDITALYFEMDGGRMAIFVRDITERKQMEKELRRSRGELEIRVQERTREVREQARILDSFFKFSTTPFVILDRGFNFIRVNEAYAKACHRDVSEFPGHNHFEFYPSDAKAKFEQVVRTKRPYVATARPFCFPDHPEWGTTYWDWTLTPVVDDAGEVEYLVFSLEDVTEHKRADEAIKRERQRFYDVFEMLPAYLVLLTPDYQVPFANRFFRERFGESRGNRCFEFLFGHSEPCKICETYTVLKTRAPHRWEWMGPDGHTYDVFDFPFTDTDGSTLILEMGIDITERKQAEEAVRESEGRLRMLSSQLLTSQETERKRIAMELHDSIGQMLTAIKFKVENYAQEKGEAGAEDKSLKRIISMVKETVEEVRRMQMDLRPSTLDDLGVLATLTWFCREYQKTYSSIHVDKEIAIREDEISIPLKVVLYRLTQEAMNNIAKHSRADLVRLSLKKQENKIEWAIEDNGTGFNLEEVFSPDKGKRGLGLASMRERTKLSGGSFLIESTQGKGTLLRAIWPL